MNATDLPIGAHFHFEVRGLSNTGTRHRALHQLDGLGLTFVKANKVSPEWRSISGLIRDPETLLNMVFRFLHLIFGR